MKQLDVLEAVNGAFADTIQEVAEFRGDTTITVDASAIVDLCLFLRDTEGLQFNYLSNVTGVDYYPQEPRFGVVYHLYSMYFNHTLGIKVLLPAEHPTVKSVTSIYPAANWLEREILDLLGITFEGHPDPRRILMPEGWDGHPLRKDYPLGYETVQFSFNFDDVEKFKPYAKE